MHFNSWITIFLREKGIDLEEPISIMGPSGLNLMCVADVVRAARAAPKAEQEAMKSKLVQIDFLNGDVRHFLRHLAGALAQ